MQTIDVRIFFVTVLTGLKLGESLARGDRLNETTFITNDITAFKTKLTPGFVSLAGQLETGFILDSTASVYSSEEVPADTDIQSYLLQKWHQLSNFLICLWLVKDNSVNHDVLFAAYTRSGGEGLDTKAKSARISVASGESVPILFSRKELAQARRLLRERFRLGEHVKTGSSAAIESSGRVERALYFIQAARGSNDTGLKIANYCSALESALATGTVELSHVLAERVAVFLEDEPMSRLELYRGVKKAYSLRSKVVHGAAVKLSKGPDFIASARYLDDILRRMVKALLSNPVQRALLDLPQEELEDHMLRRVFGASWADLVEDT